MSANLLKRLILVIGSQCEELGESAQLSFLPEAAQNLYNVMIDPDLGRCSSPLPEGGLLINPNVAEVKAAVREAFRVASKDGATLLLAFVGHGWYVGSDYYFLPRDASIEPEPETGTHIVQQIEYAYRAHPNVDGLVLLIDTCHSGHAAEQAASRWIVEPRDDGYRKLRFEILTATAPDREAWDGCFTRVLAECLRSGLNDVTTEELRCQDVERVLRNECMPRQWPQFLAFSPGIPLVSDLGLWLGRNAARIRPAWAGTWASTEIARLTTDLQPTPVLERAVTRSSEARSVVLVGGAGAGKSTVAAALMRSEVTEGVVPQGFADAVAFLSDSFSAYDLADTVAVQLVRTVTGYAAARDNFHRSLTDDERDRLDSLQLNVLGPLRHLALPSGSVVRLIVDGIDRVPSASELSIRRALNELAFGPGLDHVRLITTARTDTELPHGSVVLQAEDADEMLLRSYLTRRNVSAQVHTAIVERARGNWLVAAKLADLALASRDQDAGTLPATLRAIYEDYLRQAGASSLTRWRQELRPVLSALAVAGVGPILPMELLRNAAARLGGPDRIFRIRDILVDLRGLVVRDRPGTEDEHIGLFHQTFAEYLLDNDSELLAIGLADAHRAVLEGLEALLPAGIQDEQSPLQRYAVIREADHFWALGDYKRAEISLLDRKPSNEVERVHRYSIWKNRIDVNHIAHDRPYVLQRVAQILEV